MTYRCTHPLAALSVALLTSLSAEAASRCPLIRPPGLSPQQVDAVVLGKASESLRRQLSASELSRPFKDLDGTENAILTYSFTALAIGETLGFESIRFFATAAKTRGVVQRSKLSASKTFRG